MINTSLWKHQSDAITNASKLLDSGYNGYALLFQPGLGKTRTMLEILKNVYGKNGNRIIPTIIFCPPVVIPNWRTEILKYTKIKEERICMLLGSEGERLSDFNSMGPNSIFIVNYHGILMETLFAAMVKLAQERKIVLVLDEAHKCKTHNSATTKLMTKLAYLCEYRYLLTGTPILNELWDIWPLYNILDRGKTFGSLRSRFLFDYYDSVTRTMGARKFLEHTIKKDGAERVKEKIKDTSLFAEKSTCLDLPPLIKKIIHVDLSSEQKRIYNEMKRDMITSINTSEGAKFSIAQIALTKSLRMLQVISGHIPIHDEESNEQKVIKIKDNPRKKALQDILEDIAPYHKVIVWSVFRDNYDDIKEICKHLKLGFCELTGDTKDKQHSIDEFENNKDIRVLIGNPVAGGIGVNLVSASYMIYYSRSYSLEADIQSEARNYRPGSEKHQKITRIDLVSKGTLDELVLKCLSDKQSLSDKVLKENINEI